MTNLQVNKIYYNSIWDCYFIVIGLLEYPERIYNKTFYKVKFFDHSVEQIHTLNTDCGIFLKCKENPHEL